MIGTSPAASVTRWGAHLIGRIGGILAVRLRISKMVAYWSCPRNLKRPPPVIFGRLLFWAFLLPTIVLGHEVRPAYLELLESKTGEFSVLWKTPARGEMRLALSPDFSGTHETTPLLTRQTEDSVVQTWNIRSIESLRGRTLRILGLERTMTDVLVRVEFSDGSSWVQLLTPANPSAMVPVQQSAWQVAGQYSTLGVQHILFGIDHLLFVLALLMITRGTKRLITTITAFTVAHSLTLGLATLGYVHVPSKPVEALIALSIVMVSVEIIHFRRGVKGLTARAPWIVAFSFGLLHGFGFAGALSEIGLPEGHIPLALLFFNIGVEAGQLLFIAVVLGFLASIRRIHIPAPRWTELVPPYAIGSIAMFWVIQRMALF